MRINAKIAQIASPKFTKTGMHQQQMAIGNIIFWKILDNKY